MICSQYNEKRTDRKRMQSMDGNFWLLLIQLILQCLIRTQSSCSRTFSHHARWKVCNKTFNRMSSYPLWKIPTWSYFLPFHLQLEHCLQMLSFVSQSEQQCAIDNRQFQALGALAKCWGECQPKSLFVTLGYTIMFWPARFDLAWKTQWGYGWRWKWKWDRRPKVRSEK